MTKQVSGVEPLLRAHRQLLEDLSHLEKAAAGDGARMGPGLARARADIGRHFLFEEQNGYLDSVRQREPFKERQIQTLYGQHLELLRSLDELIQEASNGGAHALGDKVRAWVQSVRQHETEEDELVQDAFNLEIAAED